MEEWLLSRTATFGGMDGMMAALAGVKHDSNPTWRPPVCKPRFSRSIFRKVIVTIDKNLLNKMRDQKRTFNV